MSRPTHLFACLLLSSMLIAVGFGPSGASAATQELTPLQLTPALSAGGQSVMPAGISPAGVCVAAVGKRSNIRAKTIPFPPVPAALPTSTVVRGEDHRVIAADRATVAGTESLFMFVVATRHIWSVPVCRSPPLARVT